MMFVLSFSETYAQQIIKGTISDEATKETLPGAQVIIEGSNTGATADAEGHFSITVQGGDSVVLIISCIGYTSARMKVAPGTYQITLKASNNQLDQVVIASSRNATSLKRQTVSIDLIKPYLIENRITANMEHVMNQLPGVNVVDGQVNIRSGSGWTYGAGSRVLVLVDDVPMVTGDAGTVQWKFLPTDNIGSMEVIKGASSVMYGSGALNGIINIRTAEPTKKGQFKANVFNGFYAKPSRDSAAWWNGTQWYTGANTFYSKRISRLELTLGLNALNDQGYRLGEFDKRVRVNARTNYHFAKLAGFRAGIDLSVMKQQSASFLLWENFSYGYTSLDSAQTKANVTLFSFDPHADWHFVNFKLRYRGRYYGVNNDIDAGTSGVDQDNSSLNTYNELTAHYFLGRKSGTLALGTSNNYTLSQSPLYGGNDIDANNYAAFTQLDLQLRKWTINAGMRFEHFSISDQSDNQVIGRFGLAYEAGKSTFLRASAGQGYRYPTIAERYIETSVGLLNIFPNPDLRPEKGYSIEAGIRQGFSLGPVKGFADAALFYTEYDDMVEFNFGQWRARTFTTPPPTPFVDLRNFGFTSFNIGRTRISGTDVSVNGVYRAGKTEIMMLGGYTYSLPVMLEPDRVFAYDSSASRKSFTYNYTSTDTSGNPLKYRYDHQVKLDLQLTWNTKWMFGISLRYNSYMKNIDKVFVVFPVSFAAPGIDRGRALNSEGDFITDLRASFTHQRFTLTTTVNNVFNREIMSRPADLRPTRLCVIQLGYKF